MNTDTGTHFFNNHLSMLLISSKAIQFMFYLFYFNFIQSFIRRDTKRKNTEADKTIKKGKVKWQTIELMTMTQPWNLTFQPYPKLQPSARRSFVAAYSSFCWMLNTVSVHVILIVIVNFLIIIIIKYYKTKVAQYHFIRKVSSPFIFVCIRCERPFLLFCFFK